MSGTSFERVARLQERIQRLEQLLHASSGGCESVISRLGRAEATIAAATDGSIGTRELAQELRAAQSTHAWNGIGDAALVSSPCAQREILEASLPLLETVAPQLETIAAQADTINTASLRSKPAKLFILHQIMLTRAC